VHQSPRTWWKSNRPLTAEYLYVRLDAAYHEVRIDGRVVSQATVVTIGVTRAAPREFGSGLLRRTSLAPWATADREE